MPLEHTCDLFVTFIFKCFTPTLYYCHFKFVIVKFHCFKLLKTSLLSCFTAQFHRFIGYLTDWFDSKISVPVLAVAFQMFVGDTPEWKGWVIWITMEFASENLMNLLSLHLTFAWKGNEFVTFCVSDSKTANFLAPENKLWCFCVTIFCYLSDVYTYWLF